MNSFQLPIFIIKNRLRFSEKTSLRMFTAEFFKLFKNKMKCVGIYVRNKL